MQAGLCHQQLPTELCGPKVAKYGTSVVEFYRKNVLLSASVVFLNRSGKCVLFRAVWCLQEGQFCGWLIDFFLFNYRFESSSHAISMSAYLREQRRELYSRSGELQGGEIVC